MISLKDSTDLLGNLNDLAFIYKVCLLLVLLDISMIIIFPDISSEHSSYKMKETTHAITKLFIVFTICVIFLPSLRNNIIKLIISKFNFNRKGLSVSELVWISIKEKNQILYNIAVDFNVGLERRILIKNILFVLGPCLTYYAYLNRHDLTFYIIGGVFTIASFTKIHEDYFKLTSITKEDLNKIKIEC